MVAYKNNDEKYEIAIVGGGIAGLSAAWSLRDRQICLLEASNYVGGRMKSISRESYWVNLGAHVIHKEGIVPRIASELGVTLIAPQGGIFNIAMGNKVIRARHPVKLLYSLPISPNARLSFLITCLRLIYAYFRVKLYMLVIKENHCAENIIPPIPYLNRLEEQSFANLLGHMHPDVASIFHVLACRIGGEPHEISGYVGVMNFVELWGTNLLNVLGGSSRLVEAFHKKLGYCVKVGARVTQVEQNNGSVNVQYVKDGEMYQIVAKVCIVAVPTVNVIEIVKGLPLHRVETLKKVKYSPYVVGAIFTEEKITMPWDDMYALMAPKRSFCMLLNPANVIRNQGVRKPGGSLVMYAGADRASELLELDDSDICSLFLNDLYEIFPQAKGIVSNVIIQRWPQGVHILSPGRAHMQNTICKPQGRIQFAGNWVGYIGLGLELSAKSGYDAANSARKQLQIDIITS